MTLFRYTQGLPEDFDEALLVLNTRCFDRFEFGLFIADISKSDWQVRRNKRAKT